MNRANRLKQIIHIAKSELGMADDDYRAMLASIPVLEGATSTAKLSIPKLEAVLEVMKSMGFKVRPNKKSKGKPSNFDKLPAEITKIEALLADMGLPWSYADRIANQMFGIKRCAWIKKGKQLASIIAALHVEQEKRGLEESIQERMKTIDPELKAQIESHMPGNWNRNRRYMKHLLDYLIAQELQA